MTVDVKLPGMFHRRDSSSLASESAPPRWSEEKEEEQEEQEDEDRRREPFCCSTGRVNVWSRLFTGNLERCASPDTYASLRLIGPISISISHGFNICGVGKRWEVLLWPIFDESLTVLGFSQRFGIFEEMFVFVRFLRKICHYWPFWENRHSLEYIRGLFFGEILHFLGKWIVWKMWRDNFSSCLFWLLRRIIHFNILMI